MAPDCGSYFITPMFPSLHCSLALLTWILRMQWPKRLH